MRYRDRLRLWESNYGAENGWEVLLDGKIVATLDCYRREDMFWATYRLSIIATDPLMKARLASKEFWIDEGAKLVFRNRTTGLISNTACPATNLFIERGRIQFRGLYVDIRRPHPWDNFLLTCRRFWRRFTDHV